MISQVDGQERLLAAHDLENYPIVVSVGTTVDAALANWRRGAWYMSAVAIFLALAVGCIIFFISHRISQKLESQNVRLDAALNNMAHGLIMYDATGRISVVNRQYIELYGLSPAVVKPGVPKGGPGAIFVAYRAGRVIEKRLNPQL